MPTDLAKLVALENEQEQLMDAARSVIKTMTKSRRRQLLAELVRQVEADETPRIVVPAQPNGSAPRVAPPMPPRPASPHQPLVDVTNRKAITIAMRGAPPMTTGDVVAAVIKIKPDANYASIASEIARMRKLAPPMIVSKGQTASGKNDLWALAPNPPSQPPSTDPTKGGGQPKAL